MMGFGLIFVLLIAGLVAYALGWRPQFTHQEAYRESQQTPLEILKVRYARGEIGQEEYQQLRRDLEG
jgi:putative membrane protein